MAYKLSSAGLVNYLYTRLSDKKYNLNVQVEGEDIVLKFVNKKFKYDLLKVLNTSLLLISFFDIKLILTKYLYYFRGTSDFLCCSICSKVIFNLADLSFSSGALIKGCSSKPE